MALSPFERQRAELTELERDFEALQDRIEQYTDQLTSNPSVDSVLFEGITLTASKQNYIEHGLGRDFRGWRVCDSNQPAMVFRDTTVTTNYDKFLVLVPTATIVASVEIF